MSVQDLLTGPSLVSFLVSAALASTVLCALGLLAQRAARRASVPLQHGLLLTTLLMTLLVPSGVAASQAFGWGWRSPWTPTPATGVSVVAGSFAAAPERPSISGGARAGTVAAGTCKPGFAAADVTAIVAGIWLLGSGLALARLTWRLATLAVRSGQLRRTAPVLEAEARDAARALGVARAPTVYESEEACVPQVVGLLRPAIVLPAGMDIEWTAPQRHAVLVHEMAHVARGDAWFALAQAVAGAFFWWSPPLHVLNRRLNRLREDLCDNHVIRAQGHGRRLAEVLTQLADRIQLAGRCSRAGALGIIAGAEAPVVRRIVGLLRQERNTMTRLTPRAVAVLASFASLLAGCTAASTARTTADRPDAKAELRIYDIRDLEVVPQSFPAPPLDSRREPPAATPAARRDLVPLLEKSCAGAGETCRIVRLDGVLSVMAPPDVHDRIAGLLSGLRRGASAMVKVQAWLIRLRDDVSIPWATEPGGLPVRAAAVDRDWLRAQEAGGRVIDNLRLPTITIFDGQQGHAMVVNQHAFLDRYDGPGASNPVKESVSEGTVFDVKPRISSDERHVTMEFDVSRSHLLAMRERIVETPGGPLPVESPEMAVRRLRSTVTVPDGGVVLLQGFAEEGGPANAAIVTDNDRDPLLVVETQLIRLEDMEK